ncbi:hypothetical protein LCGC14_0575760 [marine sediment metagenome]|uniref:Uncharacterized protein n=1 Tax=marine sediment metagenome TaxID=412755 RepID=A0A0F9UR71_9ZZZZ
MSRAKRNKRRIQLLERDIDQGLTAQERAELDALQAKAKRQGGKKRASTQQLRKLEAELERLEAEAKEDQQDE